MATVAQILALANDSVTLINDINTNGSSSSYTTGLSQEEINARVQRNVDQLELFLSWDGTNETPNVVGSSNSKKTACADAITTGKAYIASNS